MHKQTLNENLIKNFPKAFAISASTQQLIYAFWLLDSAASAKTFGPGSEATYVLWEAVKPLLDPSVEVDWSTKIMRTFYDFEGFEQALQFGKATTLSSKLDTLEDQAVYMNILLKNKLLFEAHNFEVLTDYLKNLIVIQLEIFLPFYSWGGQKIPTDNLVPFL